MKEIPLSNGQKALVSDEDYERVSQYPWSLRGHGRARARKSKRRGGDGSYVELHRFVMDAQPGQIVDHIDGNPLNCQRENLQFITQSRNLMKSSLASRTSGTYFHKGSGKWGARCRVDGKLVYIGMFDTQADAATAVKAVRDLAWSKIVNAAGYRRA